MSLKPVPNRMLEQEPNPTHYVNLMLVKSQTVLELEIKRYIWVKLYAHVNFWWLLFIGEATYRLLCVCKIPTVQQRQTD